MNRNDMTFTVRIPRSIIGAGATSNIVNLVKDLGASKVLIVTGKRVLSAGLINPLKASLQGEGISLGVFAECEPDAPDYIPFSTAQSIPSLQLKW